MISGPAKGHHLSAKEYLMHNPGNPFSLPVHATLRHPRTGAPLRALWVRPDGRAMWPILGASPDDPPPAPTPPTPTPPAPTPPAPTPPAPTPPAPAPSDLGFPAETPVKDMTLEQQVAYHQHQSRKHEERNKEWKRLVGDKTPEQIKADLDAAEKVRQEQMTDAQRQVEEAKKQTRTESAKEFGADAARVALEFALGHDPEKNDQSSLIDTLDLTKLLTDDGKVDTAKVRTLVTTIAPAGKGSGGQRHDFGGGPRGGNTPTGIASGRSRYQERHGKKSDTD